MLLQTKTITEKYTKRFLNELADELEKLYPKGKTKCRSEALVFNAYANIIFRNLIVKFGNEIICNKKL